MKKVSFLLLFLINCLFAQSYINADSLNKFLFYGYKIPIILDTLNVNLDSIAVSNLKDSVIVKNFPTSFQVSNFPDTSNVYTFKKQATTASQDSANITTGVNNIKQLIRAANKSKGYFICNNTNRTLFFSFNTKGSFLILQPQASYFVSEEFTTLPLYATTTSASATGTIYLTNTN